MLNKFHEIKNLQIIAFGIVCLNLIYHVIAVDYYTEKPEWVKSCKVFDPEFEQCSRESVQGLMNRLTHEGIPEVTAKFGPLDPMKLEQVIFKGDNNQAVNIACNLTNLIAKGLSKMEIKESKVSKKDFSWEDKIFIPNLRLDGNYQMSGKILLIPLNGAGKISLDISDLNMLMRAKTRLYEKGDFTFYNITKIRVDITAGGVKSHLENIFNGNSKEIERTTNELFNENWREFFEALRPLVAETVANLLKNLLGAAFDVLPAKFFNEDIPKSTELYKKKM